MGARQDTDGRHRYSRPNEITSDSPPDLESIDMEIAETLGKLEQQRAILTPEAIPKDPAPVAPSRPARIASASMPDPAPGQKAPRAASPAIRRAEEQEWKKIDIFRADYASSRSGQRRRIVLIAVIATVVVGIVVCILVFR
jgi:hypothetical protein